MKTKVLNIYKTVNYFAGQIELLVFILTSAINRLERIFYKKGRLNKVIIFHITNFNDQYIIPLNYLSFIQV